MGSAAGRYVPRPASHRHQEPLALRAPGRRPLKPGAPYTIEFGCSDGSEAGPHSHATDENIIVVRGTFALGTGDGFDSTALRDLTTGSYAFMPRRVHHFGLCKGEALLVEYGIGPLTINLLGSPPSEGGNSPTDSHPPSCDCTDPYVPTSTHPSTAEPHHVAR